MAGMADAPAMYRVLKWTLPKVLNPYLSVETVGLGNVPERGGAILACNHLSFIDSLLLPLNLDRPVYFLGKAEYFRSWRTRWFFSAVGVVPVDREGGSRGRRSLETGAEILASGDLLGIYPEGTRSPDGRLYRGKTGPARLALAAGVPVVPCAVTGTDTALPTGAYLPRPRPVEVRYGRPLDLSVHATPDEDPAALRAATNELMAAVQRLSGQPYVDEYAGRIKRGEVDPPAAADGIPGVDDEAPDRDAAPDRSDGGSHGGRRRAG